MVSGKVATNMYVVERKVLWRRESGKRYMPRKLEVSSHQPAHRRSETLVVVS